jgi:hypothetical protein
VQSLDAWFGERGHGKLDRAECGVWGDLLTGYLAVILNWMKDLIVWLVRLFAALRVT